MPIDTPDWVRDAVFYQIFPDRFARSGTIATVQHLEPWDAAPTSHGFKGGDLHGVTQNLDYLQDLGVTAIYFCPIFASAANHRYHTYDYYNVDPLLGGNDALRELLDKAHERGLRMVFSITPAVVSGNFITCWRTDRHRRFETGFTLTRTVLTETDRFRPIRRRMPLGPWRTVVVASRRLATAPGGTFRHYPNSTRTARKFVNFYCRSQSTGSISASTDGVWMSPTKLTTMNSGAGFGGGFEALIRKLILSVRFGERLNTGCTATCGTPS